MGKKIYGGNVSFKATAEAIKELFPKIGEAASASIIADGRTGRSKGFGFVEMASEEDAKKAKTAMNGTTFFGKNPIGSRDKKPSANRKTQLWKEKRGKR